MDDVLMTLMNSSPISTPVLGLSSFVTAEHSARTSPLWSLQGTGLPAGGTSVVWLPAISPAQVAFRARVTDLLGLPPRGAPV